MLPEYEGFIGNRCCIPVAVDTAIVADAMASCCDRSAGGCSSGGAKGIGQLGLGLVSRKTLEAVLITIDECGCGSKIIDHVLHLGAIDQFLPLQYPAQQQADDDQNDGDFDESEAFLMAFHGMLRKKFLKTYKQLSRLCILA